LDAKGEEGMARPKADPTDRRDIRVNLRMSAVEYAAAQERADRSGLPVASFARAAILSRKLPAAAGPAVDFETKHELRRIGVNLNQIAKALNARREAMPHSLDRVCRELEAVLDRMTGYGPQDHERRPQL
jgi:hypothetical protein